MEFAFFAANFGWSLDQYHQITPVQRLFVLKAWESAVVRDTEMLQHAVELAIANTNRKKGRSYKKLWKKLRKETSLPITYGEAQGLKAAIEERHRATVERGGSSYG